MDIAQQLVDRHGDALYEESVDFFADFAKTLIMDWQRVSLERISVVHDVYYNENDLYASG